MIKKVSVKNFKSLKDVSVLTSQLNILTGLNGMGKSSFVQVLLLLRQSHLKGLLNKKLLLNEDSLAKIGTAYDAVCEDRSSNDIEFDIEFEGRSSSVKWVYEYSNEEQVKMSEMIALSDDKSDLLYNIDDFSLFKSDRFQYLNSERIGPQSLYKVSQYQVWDLNDIGKHGQYAIHYLAEWRYLNLRELIHDNCFEPTEVIEDEEEIARLVGIYDPADTLDENYDEFDSADFDLLANVNGWLGEISPGATLDPKLLRELGIVSSRVSFVRNFDAVSRGFNSNNVGFGISYVLPVIITILSAKKDDLLIIENPESHIHPKGAYMLGKLLYRAAKAGIQLFVETHSDHLIRGIKDESKGNELQNLVSFKYFKRNNNDHTTEIIDYSISSVDSIFDLEEFFSDWTVKYRDFEAKIKESELPLIITEGKTDWKHLKKAFSELQQLGFYKDLNFEFLEYDDDLKMSSSELEKLCLSLRKIKRGKKIICLFDADEFKIVQRYSPRGEGHFNKYENQVYSVCLPNPVHRESHSGVCIELYYTDDDIKKIIWEEKRLFLGNEFHEKSGKLLEDATVSYTLVGKLKGKNSENNMSIVDNNVYNETSEDIALSKNKFAEIILNEELEEVKSIDFTSFKAIFDSIEEIIKEKV